MNPSLPDPIFGNYPNQQVPNAQRHMTMNMQQMQPRMTAMPMQQMRPMQQMQQMGMQTMQQMPGIPMQQPMQQMQMQHMPGQMQPMQTQMQMSFPYQGQPRVMQNQPVMGGIQPMSSNPMIPTQMQQMPMQPQMQMQPMQGQMIQARTQSQNFMVGQQNYQPKRRLSKTQKHATVTTPPAYSPQPTVTTPQQPMAPPQTSQPASDFPQIGEVLEQLSDEQQELVFELFECAKGMPKRAEEKVEKFMNTLSQKRISAFPNGVAMVSMILDQIRTGGDMLQFVKDPPVPMVFQKRKRTRSTFKMLLSSPATLELSIPNKIRKDGDTYVIAYVYSIAENVFVTSLQSERMEIPAVQFGESRQVYVLARPGKLPQKLQLQVTFRSAQFAWLVVNYVERTPTDTLIRELFKIPPEQDVAQYVIKTATCSHSCVFDAATVLDALARDGTAVCPMCNSRIVLSELRSEKRPASVPSPAPIRVPEPEPQQRPIIIEDDPETKQARPQLYDQLTSLLKPDAISVLNSALFESSGLECDDIPPFELKGTDEYFADVNL